MCFRPAPPGRILEYIAFENLELRIEVHFVEYDSFSPYYKRMISLILMVVVRLEFVQSSILVVLQRSLVSYAYSLVGSTSFQEHCEWFVCRHVDIHLTSGVLHDKNHVVETYVTLGDGVLFAYLEHFAFFFFPCADLMTDIERLLA